MDKFHLLIREGRASVVFAAPKSRSNVPRRSLDRLKPKRVLKYVCSEQILLCDTNSAAWCLIVGPLFDSMNLFSQRSVLPESRSLLSRDLLAIF